MALGEGRPVDWRTYAEARGDIDRIVEGLEGRLKDAEGRIIARIDYQERGFDRGVDQVRGNVAELERRVRELEQENAKLRSQNFSTIVDELKRDVTVLRTTNRMLASVGTAALGIMGVVISLVALWH